MKQYRSNQYVQMPAQTITDASIPEDDKENLIAILHGTDLELSELADCILRYQLKLETIEWLLEQVYEAGKLEARGRRK